MLVPNIQASGPSSQRTHASPRHARATRASTPHGPALQPRILPTWCAKCAGAARARGPGLALQRCGTSRAGPCKPEPWSPNALQHFPRQHPRWSPGAACSDWMVPSSQNPPPLMLSRAHPPLQLCTEPKARNCFPGGTRGQGWTRSRTAACACAEEGAVRPRCSEWGPHIQWWKDCCLENRVISCLALCCKMMLLKASRNLGCVMYAVKVF